MCVYDALKEPKKQKQKYKNKLYAKSKKQKSTGHEDENDVEIYILQRFTVVTVGCLDTRH